jgi:hypothetical protein
MANGGQQKVVKVEEVDPKTIEKIKNIIEKLYGGEVLKAYNNLKEEERNRITIEWKNFISLLEKFELYDEYLNLRKEKYKYSRAADIRLIIEALEKAFPNLINDEEYKKIKAKVEEFEKQLDEKLKNVKKKTKNEKIIEIATYYHDWDVEVLWRKLSLYIYYRYANPSGAGKIADAIINDKEIIVPDYVKVSYGKEEYIKFLPRLEGSGFYNFCKAFDKLSNKDLNTISSAKIYFGKKTNLQTRNPVIDTDKAFKEGGSSITEEECDKFFEEVIKRAKKNQTIILKCEGFDPEINDPTFEPAQRVLYPWITKLRSLYTELWIINYCKEREKPEYLLFAFVLGENAYLMGIESVKEKQREIMSEIGKKVYGYTVSMIDAFEFIAERTDKLITNFLNLYKKDGEEINRSLEYLYKFLDENKAEIPKEIKEAFKDENTYPNVRTKSPDPNRIQLIESSIFLQLLEKTVYAGEIKPGMEKEKIESKINNVTVDWPYFEAVTYKIDSDPSSITYRMPKKEEKKEGVLAQGTMTFKFEPNVYGVSDGKIAYIGRDKRDYSCSLRESVKKEGDFYVSYTVPREVKREDGSIVIKKDYNVKDTNIIGYTANFSGYGENFDKTIEVKQKQINIIVSVTPVLDNLSGWMSYICHIKMDHDELNASLLKYYKNGEITPYIIITLDKGGNIVYRLSTQEFEDLVNAAKEGESYEIEIRDSFKLIPAHYKEIRLLEASLLFLPANLDKEIEDKDNEINNLESQIKTLKNKNQINNLESQIKTLKEERKLLKKLKDLEGQAISVSYLESLPNRIQQLHSGDVKDTLSYYNIVGIKTKLPTQQIPPLTALSTSFERPAEFKYFSLKLVGWDTRAIVSPFQNAYSKIRPKEEIRDDKEALRLIDNARSEVNNYVNYLDNYGKNPGDLERILNGKGPLPMDEYLSEQTRFVLEVLFIAAADEGKVFINGQRDYLKNVYPDEADKLSKSNVPFEEKISILMKTNIGENFGIYGWVEVSKTFTIEGEASLYTAQFNVLKTGEEAKYIKGVGIVTGISAMRLTVKSKDQILGAVTYYYPISGMSLDFEIDKVNGILEFTGITDGTAHGYSLSFIPRNCQPFIQAGAGGVFLLGKKIYLKDKKFLGIPIPGIEGSALDIFEGLGTMGSVTLTMPYPGADWQVTYIPRFLTVPLGRIIGVPVSVSVDTEVGRGMILPIVKLETNTPAGYFGINYNPVTQEWGLSYSCGEFSMQISRKGIAIKGAEKLLYLLYKNTVIPSIKEFQLGLAMLKYLKKAKAKYLKKNEKSPFEKLSYGDQEMLRDRLVYSYLEGDYTLASVEGILKKIEELINGERMDEIKKIISSQDNFRRFIYDNSLQRIKGKELRDMIEKEIKKAKTFDDFKNTLLEDYKKRIDMGEAKTYFDAIMAERAFNYVIEELKKDSQPDVNKYPGYLEKKGDAYYIKFPTLQKRNQFMKKVAYLYNVREKGTFPFLLASWRYADLLSTDDKIIRMAGLEPVTLPGGEQFQPWWTSKAKEVKIEKVGKKEFESTYYAEVNTVDVNVRSFFYDERVIERFKKAYKKGVYLLPALGEIIRKLAKEGKEKIDEVKSSEKAFRDFVEELGLARIKGEELRNMIKEEIERGIKTFDEFKEKLPEIYNKRIDMDEAYYCFWILSGEAEREKDEIINEIKRDLGHSF